MTRRSSRPLALIVTLLALALAGCSGVPTSGPVTRASAAPGRVNPGVEIAPAPPGLDATPIEVVEGFLHAMASWQPNYAVARAYLTEDASSRWRPDAGVRIYAQGNPVVATDSGAMLRAPVVGTLDAAGAYRQSAGMLSHDFGLVLDARGQWRVGNPPDGLVISEYLFSSAFARVTAYFFAPGGGWLVPDPRYFPRGAQAREGAARAVLGGATEWLAPSVGGAHPGALLDRVDLSPAGVVQVVLRKGANDLGDAERVALTAQLVWTFRQFESVVGVQIAWRGEEPWLIAPYGRSIPVTAFPEADPTDRQASRQLFAVMGGRLVRATEGPQGMDNLVVAPGVTNASLAAVRSDALLAAAVVDDRSGLVLAPLGEPDVSPLGGSVGLRRPHFDRRGDLWVVNDAGAMALVSVDASWREVAVAGLGEGRVEAFRVAPDGARMALVVQRPTGQRAVGLARVVRGADGAVSLEGWRELTVTTSSVGPANVLDVGWRAPDSLLVLVADGRTTTVLAVAQDGSTVAPIGPSTTPDLVELAVAPGVPPMVRAANGDVWRYNSDFRWSLHTSGVASAFYPG
ncbi:MAG: LpqB family beta-propeller domain-containing protein [Actinomycetes bacterium]